MGFDVCIGFIRAEGRRSTAWSTSRRDFSFQGRKKCLVPIEAAPPRKGSKRRIKKDLVSGGEEEKKEQGLHDFSNILF